MKQNTYNKGRNKNFTPKSKKFKSQPLKEDFDKKETIEETLDQRLNNEEFYKLKYCSTVVYMVPRA